MLVLTRKRNERIIIHGTIEVVVVAVQGARVKLGFDAPNDVAIHREEVHRRIKTDALRERMPKLNSRCFS